MPLTDTAVRQAKPREKPYTITDGDGLSLHISPNGTKAWHFRYIWGGKQLRISFGTYPELSLKDARERREAGRANVAKGIDPRVARVTHQPEELLFRQVADEWHAFKSGRWAADSRKGAKDQARRVLDNDILKVLGDTPFKEVTRAQVVQVNRNIEKRGALNIAEKARSWTRQIFDFGIAHGYRDNNPATGIEAIAQEQPPVQHNPIISRDGDDIKALLRGICEYGGSHITQIALWTLLYTGVRTIELRRAAPGDFDLEAGIWIVPPTAVKQLRGRVRRDGAAVENYVVPLPTQLIKHLRPLLEQTARYPFAFPGRNDPSQMMSENTLNQAVKRLGLNDKLTGHGLRGTLSTALYEMGYPEHLVESQLSHASPNKSRVAYDHASYVEERRVMMQAWADHLDGLLSSAS